MAAAGNPVDHIIAATQLLPNLNPAQATSVVRELESIYYSYYNRIPRLSFIEINECMNAYADRAFDYTLSIWCENITFAKLRNLITREEIKQVINHIDAVISQRPPRYQDPMIAPPDIRHNLAQIGETVRVEMKGIATRYMRMFPIFATIRPLVGLNITPDRLHSLMKNYVHHKDLLSVYCPITAQFFTGHRFGYLDISDDFLLDIIGKVTTALFPLNSMNVNTEHNPQVATAEVPLAVLNRIIDGFGAFNGPYQRTLAPDRFAPPLPQQLLNEAVVLNPAQRAAQRAALDRAQLLWFAQSPEGLNLQERHAAAAAAVEPAAAAAGPVAAAEQEEPREERGGRRKHRTRRNKKHKTRHNKKQRKQRKHRTRKH